jgi:hypothetical protein
VSLCVQQGGLSGHAKVYCCFEIHELLARSTTCNVEAGSLRKPCDEVLRPGHFGYIRDFRTRFCIFGFMQNI